MRLFGLLLLMSLLGGCSLGSLEFEYPWVLGAGLAVLVLLAAWRIRQRRGAAMAYSRVGLVQVLPGSVRTRAFRVAPLFRFAALLALVVALSRPQQVDFEQRAVEGIDIFLLLDMSGSMYAVDMPAAQIQRYQMQHGEDPPNRFDNAIVTLKRLVDGRSRDRIGMVVFAREAYLQFPLTLDYGTIQTILDRLELDAIDASATAIGNALGLGVRGLINSDAESRTIILITDGKQQGGNISPAQAADVAQAEGIRIYSILVGGEGDTMAPSNFRNRDGTRRFVQTNYPVDAALLERISNQTGGRFYKAELPEELEMGLNAILDELDTSDMIDVASVDKKEVFLPFVLLSLGFLLAEGLLVWGFARRFP